MKNSSGNLRHRIFSKKAAVLSGGALLAVAGLSVLLFGGLAGALTTCTKGGSIFGSRVILTIGGGETARLFSELDPEIGEARIKAEVGNTTPPTVISCSTATTTNTDGIEVNSVAGLTSETFKLDLDIAGYQPGDSIEIRPISEIEIQVDMKDGAADTLVVLGSSSATDNIRAGFDSFSGSKFFNLNAVPLEPDADMEALASVESIQIDGRGGDDIISAAGGQGTVDPMATGVTIGGGMGNDQLTGGNGNDTFDEGSAANGSDSIDGGLGTDHASYSLRTADVRVSLDGLANDGEAADEDNVMASVEKITTGGGNDTLSGASSGGSYEFNAGLGNDTFSQGTTKNSADTMNGGLGVDTVDYQLRGVAVTVNLATAVAGESGEGDVPNGIENANGGLAGDSLAGDSLGNTLNGGNGDDNINGSGGTDVLNGGEGNDIIAGGTANDLIDGGLGNDTVNGNGGPDMILGGVGDDNLTGGPNNDTVLGGDGNDTIAGGGAVPAVPPTSDTLLGEGGNDTFIQSGVSTPNEVIIGGSGTDIADYNLRSANLSVSLDGNANDGAVASTESDNVDVEVVIGGSGNDALTGSASTTPNTLKGGPGNDTISGGGAPALRPDTLNGGPGNDTFPQPAVGGGAELIFGNDPSDPPDSDTVDYSGVTQTVLVSLNEQQDDGQVGEGDSVSGSVEIINTGDGADTLTGASSGSYTFNAGGGNDTFNQGLSKNSADTMNGGLGTDIVDYQLRDASVNDSLDGVANDGASGEADNANVENVTGTRFDDVLVGNTSANALTGGNGNDQITGKGAPGGLLGSDSLSGGENDDTFPQNGSSTPNEVISGGRNTDTVDYSGRSAAVNVSIDGAANDGASGEGDNVDADLIIGGSGDDTISGTSSNGGPGNDTLTGTTGANTLNGGPGNDTITGLGSSSSRDNDMLNGDDLLQPLVTGNDTFQQTAAFTPREIIDGGLGIDTVNYGSRGNAVLVSLDQTQAQPQNDGEAGEADNVKDTVEIVTTGGGADILSGSSSGGPYTFNAGGGNDTFSQGTAKNSADTMNGQGDTDIVDYQLRAVSVTVNLATGSSGEAGENDLASGIENANGGFGVDTLTGTTAANTLNGGEGNDTIAGGGAPSGQADTLNGGGGDDKFTQNGASTPREVMNGGSGTDTADYSSRTANLSVSLDGNANDGASGEADNVGVDVENVRGGSGNDNLQGSAQNNTLEGNGGKDVINGKTGIDTMSGGDGDDTINACDSVADMVSGGLGDDVGFLDDSVDTSDGTIETVSSCSQI